MFSGHYQLNYSYQFLLHGVDARLVLVLNHEGNLECEVGANPS